MMRAVEAMARADYPARAMTRTTFLAILTCALAAATPALAQQMYPGQGITVNAGAVGGSGARASDDTAIIHLHMPVEHHRRHVAAKRKPVHSDVATAAAPPPPPPVDDNAPLYARPLDSLSSDAAPVAAAPSPKRAAVKKAAAPAPTPAPAPEDNIGQDSALPLALDPTAPRAVAPPRKHSASTAPPAQTASIGNSATTTIVPAHDATPPSANGLSKRSEILFPRGEPDVSPTTVNKMRALAADLNTLLSAGAQRVQLDAYGGKRGDKGSEARRLSLKRALGIRQLLIEDGVPSESIDVRAMGGIEDGGAPDRVDVFVRNG